MEKRVDFLTLNTGKTFLIPFDELLIFSTNLLPEDIMDPAFLRRIPYKVELNAPGMEEYRQLFQMLCAQHELPCEDWVPDYCAEKLQTVFDQPLAFYQPRFIVEQCIASCKYLDQPTRMDRNLLDDAMENLSAKSESAREAKHEPAGASGAHTRAKAIQSPYAPQP
jgi:SpoVK/Ycf46/Vps4 family AAA+-type ATPase